MLPCRTRRCAAEFLEHVGTLLHDPPTTRRCSAEGGRSPCRFCPSVPSKLFSAKNIADHIAVCRPITSLAVGIVPTYPFTVIMVGYPSVTITFGYIFPRHVCWGFNTIYPRSQQLLYSPRRHRQSLCWLPGGFYPAYASVSATSLPPTFLSPITGFPLWQIGRAPNH